jgi:hypothetical protein
MLKSLQKEEKEKTLYLIIIFVFFYFSYREMPLKENILAYKLHYLIAIVGCLLVYYRFGLSYATFTDTFSSASQVRSKNGLFTKDELAKYDGGSNSRGLFISILGSVFDVAKGEQHYGPGGSYNVFAGGGL